MSSSTTGVDKTPKPLTDAEWAEVAALNLVREAWGLDTEDQPVEQLKALSYGARFDFVTGGPGYVGDLFVIHDDAFGGPPLVLIRQDGKHAAAPNLCGNWPNGCAAAA